MRGRLVYSLRDRLVYGLLCRLVGGLRGRLSILVDRLRCGLLCRLGLHLGSRDLLYENGVLSGGGSACEDKG